MDWTITPDRFYTGNGSWKPKWKFQPTKKIEHALALLEASSAVYTIRAEGENGFYALVQIGDSYGEARDKCKPKAITLAVANASVLNGLGVLGER